jgi:aspartyl-tRNA(Asn)/glutamyl-tRNA(Gln) amidotransferase subunit B
MPVGLQLIGNYFTEGPPAARRARCSRPPTSTPQTRGSLSTEHDVATQPDPCLATKSSSASRPTPSCPRSPRSSAAPATAFGAEPNTQACAVDLALPGTLPVMNRGAVERAIRIRPGRGRHIAPRASLRARTTSTPTCPRATRSASSRSRWCRAARSSFFLGDEKKSVRLVRAHLEEDAGKSLHEDFIGQSGIDLNRAGTPLLEIVTEPDMRSSAEAVAYAKELHKIVTWIGHLRRQHAGRQLPLRRQRVGAQARRTAGHAARDQEPEQLQVHAAGDRLRDPLADRPDRGRPGAIQQATVLFDPDTGETRAMRTKEDAHDYRYFPDPDLPPLVIAPEWVERACARKWPSCRA